MNNNTPFSTKNYPPMPVQEPEQETTGNDVLQISLKRGEYIIYQSSSYTDYMVNGGLFVVLKGDQWVGIYNMDCVEYVAYIEGGHDEN